ncbi:unnamed protein product [Schistosoma curassoni]|uniref:Lanthionine synthetase C-like protein n=1 Tax=Schistosoma curassoni TaxID=6186 RepID=A0A183KWA2_9TREM|nr:unnamed protein product [Schistosoma curassoni]
MYTGLSGVGLFYNFLSQCKCELLDRKIRENGVVCTEKLLNRCLRHINLKELSKNISVYTSPIGPLCLGALSSVKHGSENTEAKKFVEDILSANAILKSGQKTAGAYKSNGFYNRLMYQSSKRDLCMPPLIFEWYNECYLGAAHGFAGILTTLLKKSLDNSAAYGKTVDEHKLNKLHQ